MNNYTPHLGLQLKSREQNLRTLYQYLYDNSIFTESYEFFLGSNWHKLISSSVLPLLEGQQAQFVASSAALFSYWQEQHMLIKGSTGSSYEGFIHRFSPHCKSVQLVTMQEDKSILVPGELAIYFDTLEDMPTDQLADLFAKAMPIAIFTPQGNHSIEVPFSLVNKKTYKYNNLVEKDYTVLDLRLNVSYKSSTIAYEKSLIMESVRSEFDRLNHIGQSFYPKSYFDHNRLPNIASMRVDSALAGELNYLNNFRKANFGEKFVIGNMDVVVAESE
jgi:hypothetical protein